MVTWRWFARGVVCLAVVGCGDPGVVVPAVPPGLEPERKPPATEKEPEALGEELSRPRPTSSAPAATPAADATIAPAPPTAKGETKTTASGVKYETLVEGNGPEAKPGQTVRVHYTGVLEDGKKFDSSRDKGTPFTFVLGQGQVIRGWDEGVSGMKVGERRKLTVPPSAGYGSKDMGVIPPNSALIFDVELLGVE